MHGTPCISCASRKEKCDDINCKLKLSLSPKFLNFKHGCFLSIGGAVVRVVMMTMILKTRRRKRRRRVNVEDGSVSGLCGNRRKNMLHIFASFDLGFTSLIRDHAAC
mmetsp:Transcript_16630/g.31527  ORF Transcript_16630/g.31527 Transcript_16630/m.31527 type:complete len:107 (-) Transcript_16630:126-446(-)